MRIFFKAIFFSALFFYSCGNKNSLIEVSIRQLQVPVLKNKSANPIIIIKIKSSEQKSLTSIKINLKGTDDLNDISLVNMINLGKDSVLNKTNQLNFFGIPMQPTSEMTFHDKSQIDSAPTFFMVTFQLANNANLHHRVDANCVNINFADYSLSKPIDQTPHIRQRIGVAVRQQNDDNVHTYRIPGITTTNEGTLLAVYDVRRESGRDLQGDIDIGVSRSTDGGNSWEPMQIGLDIGSWGNLPQKFNGVSDPCILVDQNSNKIFLAGLWMYGVINDGGKWIEGLTPESTDWNHQWKNKGSQPGFGVKQTSQFLVSTSTDDGKSWAEPVNLTKMCKNENWWLWAPAPGHGITLEDGTLVFPTQGRDKEGETFSNFTYSTNGGVTWITSNQAYTNTTENMAVQLTDGSIMLNMRDNRNRSEKGAKNGRAVAVTNDLGKTWDEHPSSHGSLIEPVCMASIHKHRYMENEKEKTLLLFSNPNTKNGRHHMTIKVSLDDGKTWPEKYWFLLDEGESFGYSCLTSIDESTIGILYEGSQAHMTFERIPLSEILLN